MSWCFWRASCGGGGGALCVAMSNGGVSAECVYTHAPRVLEGNRKSHAWPERCVRRLADRRAPEAVHFFYFFFARRAGLKDTHAHGIHARLPERVRARGFRESYRILRPAKLPLAAHARGHADARRGRRFHPSFGSFDVSTFI